MTKRFSIKRIILHIIYFICFSATNNILPSVPFSVALFIGLNYYEPYSATLAAVFMLSFGIFMPFDMWISGAIIGISFCIIFSFYRSKHRTPHSEIIFFTIACLLPYALINGNIIEKAIYSAIICIFSYVTYNAVNFIKDVEKRSSPEISESICSAVIFVAVSVGAIKLGGIGIYSSFCVLTILCFEKLTLDARGAIIAGILAFAPTIVSGNPSFFENAFLWFTLSIIFMKRSKAMAAFSLVLGEAFLAFAINFYDGYDVFDAMYIVIPALFFAFLPENIFKEINRKFTLSADELICKNYINRSRTILSSRLYEISGVFFQMQSSFEELKKCTPTKEHLTEKIAAECVSNVCYNCETYERCRLKSFPKKEDMERLTALGINKKRLTLIDLPRDFTENCLSTNSLIFEINRLIASHIDQIKATEGMSEAKQLLGLQVEGLGNVMKNLAFDFSKSLTNGQNFERKILTSLKRVGIPVSAALVFGEDSETEICIFTDSETSESIKLKKTLSEIMGVNLITTEITPFSDKIVSCIFKKAPQLDAVFGVSSITKSGSTRCGDTHSLIKIDEGKFLVALSDGMGSGVSAEATSATSLNLIESFYRAGLDSPTILSTVNKILSLNVDDNFAAIDLGIVNLYERKTDFIKIGAPYGFLLSEDGIRFIEGSSLPLGILDELKPNACSQPINENDVIIMLSDGITDAFGSSSDLIEFLKALPNKNPQALSESIVEKALYLCGNTAKDDMTALCVRLIEKIA